MSRTSYKHGISTPSETLSQYLTRIFLDEKLLNKEGFLVLTLSSILNALIVGKFGITGAAMIVILLVALPTIYAIVAYPKFGMVTLLFSSYFIMFIIRMNLVDFPLGTVMDTIQALLILGFFIKQKSHADWSIFKDAIGIGMLVWIAYNVFQVANPVADSRMAWLYTIRSVAAVMLMYFIFVYHIKTIQFIRFILKMWLALGAFAAIYGFKQEYVGFFAFEELSLQDDLLRSLLFIDGVWRKFSIFSDPVAFSYNMVTCSIFCITMLFGDMKGWKKLVLSALAVLYIWSMLFSGTRGAYVMIPAAIGLLTVINFNRRVFFFAIGAGVLLFLVVNTPTSNQSIKRFQSAFKPSEDASYNVRTINQKRIQPYIRTHPFGGGLGATGAWGARFSPGSFLSKFPPDSGYVRVAVEIGWVGLIVFCSLIFIVLRTGINNYYKIDDPELKRYCLAMILIVFAYALGNYPQEAIVQFPSNIYFYFFIALLTITFKLDQEMKKAKGPALLNKTKVLPS